MCFRTYRRTLWRASSTSSQLKNIINFENHMCLSFSSQVVIVCKKILKILVCLNLIIDQIYLLYYKIICMYVLRTLNI